MVQAAPLACDTADTEPLYSPLFSPRQRHTPQPDQNIVVDMGGFKRTTRMNRLLSMTILIIMGSTWMERLTRSQPLNDSFADDRGC